jgi:hypothetical protein
MRIRALLFTESEKGAGTMSLYRLKTFEPTQTVHA